MGLVGDGRVEAASAFKEFLFMTAPLFPLGIKAAASGRDARQSAEKFMMFTLLFNRVDRGVIGLLWRLSDCFYEM